MTAKVLRTTSLAFLAAGALATAAQAQGINVDFDSQFPTQGGTPATYPAAGTAGTWNQITGGTTGPFALVDKSGAATGATLTLSAGTLSSLEFANALITGDHALLMNDIVYDGVGPALFTFTGLADGPYTVYTYAMAPDNKTGFISGVDIAGAPEGPQNVGGFAWTGAHAQGTSYAMHTTNVTGGTLVITVTEITTFMSINGIQLEGGSGSAGTPYCFGDGTGAPCPCANLGAAGEGCANSGGTGVTLSGSGATGTGAGDTLVLDVVGVPGAKPGLLLRGDNQITAMVGGGLLCVGANTQRSQVQITDAGGATTFSDWNGAGFESIANAGSPTQLQFWYRDPSSPCAGTNFNFSNGLSVTYP